MDAERAGLNVTDEQSARDAERLMQAIPKFQDYPVLAREHERRLKANYDEYVSRVSAPDMAVSLELATFIAVMCDLLTPARVLDLGSGFSSYVFRDYASRAIHDPLVVSVDDDSSWLGRTSHYLSEKDMDTSGLITWQVFAKEESLFDFVLHDLGDMDTRIRTLPQVIRLVPPGSILLLDDIHKPEYGPIAQGLAEDDGMKALSLRAFTTDQFGRYAMLAYREPFPTGD